MMNQENYVNVNDLHKQGWTISEIAAETGWHRTTVSKYLKDGPPAARATEAPVMTEEWRSRIDTMLGAYPRLLSVSVHNKLRAEGFEGSYPTVVRAVRDLRGPRFRAANLVSVPIHTAPGDEAQFDFCDVSGWAARFGWRGPLFVFGMILSWSRWRLWWFTTSQDRHHTFEGMARFFDEAGGVPAACRTDRMGALGRSQGRRFELHPPTVGFAAHHGTKITSCQAGDAKRKGKVERPFRQLQETFLPEVEADGIPVDIADLNRRAQVWLTERVHGVESRTTGETPAQRLEVERDFLAPLPRVRFDTDYVETRRVHNAWPFVTIDANRYSVPPEALGHKVEIRRKVDDDNVEVRLAGRLIATHRLVGGRRVDVWDPVHRRAAEILALGWDPGGPDLRLIADRSEPARVERLALDGDYDVAPPDLDDRYNVTIDDAGVSA
ncbi:MAG TPA: IS21 family transposase [Rhodoglobus sp.]|jgi:transposase|nr:IS21 family transposase [Rhodoglobus sp.]HQJ36033.1 IS21 family transposase [Rhodoglobus sp.]